MNSRRLGDLVPRGVVLREAWLRGAVRGDGTRGGRRASALEKLLFCRIAHTTLLNKQTYSLAAFFKSVSNA